MPLKHPKGATHCVDHTLRDNKGYYRVGESGDLEVFVWGRNEWQKSNLGVHVLENMHKLEQEKTYTMHITMDCENFYVTTDSNPNTWFHAYRVFDSICRSMLFGFGDAKSNKLYDLMETLKPNTFDTLEYKHQGYKVHIRIGVNG